MLQVSVPLPPEAIDPDARSTTDLTTKNANRVVVTINGGGDADGGGGGINQISLTAGGTTRNTLADGQQPQRADVHADAEPLRWAAHADRRRFGLDRVRRIGHGRRRRSSSSSQSLAGTPVQIQIVRFDNTASVLGTTGVVEVLRHDHPN